MVKRLVLAKKKDGRARNGGPQRNAGRRLGSEGQIKRIARAKARMSGDGLLPHELLFQWAQTGKMGKLALTPADRIACAKGCASWYKAPLAATRAPGDAPQAIMVTLDDRLLQALAGDPSKAQVLREVIAMVGAGDNASAITPAKPADASRYAQTLRSGTPTVGSA